MTRRCSCGSPGRARASRGGSERSKRDRDRGGEGAAPRGKEAGPAARRAPPARPSVSSGDRPSGDEYREPFGEHPEGSVEPEVFPDRPDRPGGRAPPGRGPAPVLAPQEVLLHHAGGRPQVRTVVLRAAG